MDIQEQLQSIQLDGSTFYNVYSFYVINDKISRFHCFGINKAGRGFHNWSYTYNVVFNDNNVIILNNSIKYYVFFKTDYNKTVYAINTDYTLKYDNKEVETMQEYIQYKLNVLRDFKIRVKKADIRRLQECQNEIQIDQICKQLIIDKLNK